MSNSSDETPPGATDTKERLALTIRSMALVAHYIGGIDGKFDTEEYEEAADPLVLDANLHALLYEDNLEANSSIQAVIDDLSEDTLQQRLIDAIRAIDGELSSEELMERLKRCSADAKELNGLLPAELNGDTAEEHRREIKEYVEQYDLNLGVSDTADMDVLYESFNEAIEKINAEPFRMNLAYALVHYGTYIGYASGSIFSSSPYSEEEEEAVKDVGLVFGLPPFNLKNTKLQAEMGADAMDAITSDSFMEELNETVGM